MRILPILRGGCLSLAYAAPQPPVVAVPAAEVWNKTVSDPDFFKDDNRETQVLKGERVIVKEVRGEWARIEAVEQPEFTHHQRWEGYPGWVYVHLLDLQPAPAPASTPEAEDIMTTAESFLRTPYLWAGLTIWKKPRMKRMSPWGTGAVL